MLASLIRAFIKFQSENIEEMHIDSMTEYTKSTRTEPIVMVDHRISTLPQLTDLMKTLTSIYAAMYCQSFSIAINKEIGNIKVLQTLDKINPRRDTGALISKGIGGGLNRFGFNSQCLKLPNYKKPGFGFESVSPVISMEKVLPTKDELDNYKKGKVGQIDDSKWETDKDGNKIKPLQDNPKMEVDIDSINKFNQNLTTGLLFNVSVKAEGREVEIPISVRLMANNLQSANILSIMEASVRNTTAKERWHEWRAGSIDLWTDVILCRDILREYRRNLIKDNTGLLREIERRKSDNKLVSLFQGKPSISQISNILIVSKQTMDEFERNTFKKIKDVKTREQIFKHTQVLILCIVNELTETVTFYYQDINVPTVATFKELKSSGKNGNVDTMEILKAFQMGNGIRL